MENDNRKKGFIERLNMPILTVLSMGLCFLLSFHRDLRIPAFILAPLLALIGIVLSRHQLSFPEKKSSARIGLILNLVWLIVIIILNLLFFLYLKFWFVPV